jgi:parallel beta-helix repeat protein
MKKRGLSFPAIIIIALFLIMIIIASFFVIPMIKERSDKKDSSGLRMINDSQAQAGTTGSGGASDGGTSNSDFSQEITKQDESNKEAEDLIQLQNKIPNCTESDWTYNITPLDCPLNGNQTKAWTKIGNCENGTFHDVSEIISCNPNIPTCTSFTYTGWSECISSGTQSRNVLSSSPNGCQNGIPVLSQECEYVAPSCVDETSLNFCSLTKPLYCDVNGELSYNCNSCGCEEGYACGDGNCVSPNNVFYISTIGDDSNDGTINNPFATLEKARDEIRELKQEGQFNQPINVYVRQGIYELNQTFVLNSQDPGTSDKPITYQAYPNEKVIISGGKKLDLNWEPYNNGIYVADVSSFISKYGNFNSLFVNEKRAIRAREPNNDLDFPYYQINHTDEENTTSFYFTNGDINSNWYNIQDIEIISYRTWFQSRFKIDRVQGNKVYIEGSLQSQFPYGSDYYGTDRYYIENVFEGLDNPGEWYLDKLNNKLYYYPLVNENLDSSKIIVPVLDQLGLIMGTSLSDIAIRGITFSYSDWKFQENYAGYQGGVSITQSPAIYFNCDNCIFENNIISHVGVNALGSDSKNIRIINNNLYDSGAGGIRIGGRSDGSSVIENNRIHDFGSVYKEGAGIFVGSSGNNLISHNEIFNGSYSGISLCWWNDLDGWCKDNIVENNLIYDVMQELNDGAGIYTIGKQLGTVIKNNIFHDIKLTEKHIYPWAITAIYLDVGSDILVKDNLAYKNDQSLLIHRASNNTIKNNLFIDGDHYQVLCQGREDLDYSYTCVNNTFTNNIVYYTSPLFYDNPDAIFNGLTNAPILWTQGVNHCFNYSDNNLFFSPNDVNLDTKVNNWLVKSGHDTHSIVLDPLFVDYANNDFTLLPSSPAFDLGFEQIDFSDVGPRGIGELPTTSPWTNIKDWFGRLFS